MNHDWNADEIIEHFTLLPAEVHFPCSGAVFLEGAVVAGVPPRHLR